MPGRQRVRGGASAGDFLKSVLKAVNGWNPGGEKGPDTPKRYPAPSYSTTRIQGKPLFNRDFWHLYQPFSAFYGEYNEICFCVVIWM